MDFRVRHPEPRAAEGKFRPSLSSTARMKRGRGKRSTFWALSSPTGRTQAGEDLAFRPFFYRKEETEAVYAAGIPLPPWEIPTNGPGSGDRTFMPFYSTRRGSDPEGRRKKRNGDSSWPSGGRRMKGESYGGFFPLYGNLKKRFGKDEMNFFLWPIYSDSRDGRKQDLHLPLAHFSPTAKGGKRGVSRSGRWGAMTGKRMITRRRFFLWPIFHFEKRYLYTDDPTEINMVFPFYVSMDSSQAGSPVRALAFFHLRSHDDG